MVEYFLIYISVPLRLSLHTNDESLGLAMKELTSVVIKIFKMKIKVKLW